jgi:hypothetical protein
MDWVLDFTKHFLAFRPKIFGTERFLASQSQRRELLLNLSKRTPNEQHDHSSPPLLDLDKGGGG